MDRSLTRAARQRQLDLGAPRQNYPASADGFAVFETILPMNHAAKIAGLKIVFGTDAMKVARRFLA